MTEAGDQGVSRLDEVRSWLEAHGLATVIEDFVGQLWRGNCDRHDPDEFGDDQVTLGINSARNIANKLRWHISHDVSLTAAGVHVTHEHSAVVIGTPVADLRLVKAPPRSGRHPRFDRDFNWTNREGRRAAAMRNAQWVNANGNPVDGDGLFDFPNANPTGGLDGCRDVFIVWAGVAEPTLTSGWLGLPTTGAYPFVAVLPLWRDEATSRTVADVAPADGGDVMFGTQPAPQPVVTLKASQRPAGQQ